jgi:tetratricopeptide (TPR) repeat protein
MEQLGRLDEALDAWTRVARMEPDADVYWSLGRCLYGLGRRREAVVVLEEAVRQAPDHVPALLLLSRAGQELGEDDTARDYMEKAFRVGPARARELLETWDNDVAAPDPGST